MIVKLTRQKKIVAVSHCILNQNVVINDWERAEGAFPMASYLLNAGISFLQLPCPEFLELGMNRPPMTYQQYQSINGYRERCRTLLHPIIQQLIAYRENHYHYLGIIGINDSPNCSISGQRGILMEEFFDLCQKNDLNQAFMEIPLWYRDDQQRNMATLVETFIQGDPLYDN